MGQQCNDKAVYDYGEFLDLLRFKSYARFRKGSDNIIHEGSTVDLASACIGISSAWHTRQTKLSSC
jgi:hypothetical protein